MELPENKNVEQYFAGQATRDIKGIVERVNREINIQKTKEA